MTRRRNPRNSIVRPALVGLALGLTLSLPQARAQVAGATMTGTVSDISGAVIPNAQVLIKNVATGHQRPATTDAAGLYAVPNLLPGSYQVTVTAPGFSTEVRSGITLTVGAQQVLNVTMKVGQTTQKVKVSGAAPTVQLSTSSISHTVNSTTVRQLPLNGRDWTQLATLQPGVNSLGSDQANTGLKDRAHRGYGVQMAISGTRPQFNNYRIDGISVNDYTNGGPGSVVGATLGVDAIQEFSVITTNYSAAYGRTAGGVVNALTRSGTNQFHGDAYEFLRNDAFDAANFFDNFSNTPKPAFRQNQFGASLG
ncbi:MAG: carboxypeptidase regulatory-like domain-containing protein, partial [Terriglobia bacterium]